MSTLVPYILMLLAIIQQMQFSSLLEDLVRFVVGRDKFAQIQEASWYLPVVFEYVSDGFSAPRIGKLSFQIMVLTPPWSLKITDDDDLVSL
jgi:hypothetical protein